MIMRLQVQHLRNGDVMRITGEKVLRWFIGTRTPSGKVRIELLKDGRLRYAEWGKYTMVSIVDRVEAVR